MEANFQQHIAGSAQMMSQQKSQQQQQRAPQANPQSLQIQTYVYNALTAQPPILTGWQASVPINERLLSTFNIIKSLRLASQQQSVNTINLPKIVEMALKFERECFVTAPSKDGYKQEIQNRLEHLQEKRNQQQSMPLQGINQQIATQAQPQQMMINQNGIQTQGQRPMPSQLDQHVFPNSPHRTQASPMTGQQTQMNQIGIHGTSKNSTNPRFPMIHQQQSQPQQQPQQSQQTQISQQSQQQQLMMLNMATRNGPKEFTRQENAKISEYTSIIMSRMSEEAKNEQRTKVISVMNQAAKERCRIQGLDPLEVYCRQQAAARFLNDRARLAQQHQQQQHMQAAQKSQTIASSTPIQATRSMPPNTSMGQAQALNPASNNSDFNKFMGSVDVAAHQQQQGVMAQAEGQIVVPANPGPQSSNPQSLVMPGMPMNMAEQHPAVNSNSRVQQQQQQQMFNAQHLQLLQNQRLQQVAQAQQQAPSQIRLNHGAQVARSNLPGQLAGLGSGQIPPKTSPSMTTLNAPMRTPQLSRPGPSLNNNPNSQFVAPTDSRFLPGNQKQQSAPINGAALFTNVAGQPGLQSDKLNEMMNSWQNGSASIGNMPHTPSTPNRAGPQMMQPAQFSGGPVQPNQLAQAPNIAQRTSNLAPNMSPQQQLLLQQQMASLRSHANPPPQRNLPANLIMTEQQMWMQMDNADIPPSFLTQQNMPQGFPPDIRKWGQLKRWAETNPIALETIKNLQKSYFQHILQRNRAGQQNNMSSQVTSDQSSNSIPGVAAPVAPMLPKASSMQMVRTNISGEPLRQPTHAEIQALRNFPGGKMLNATDEQLRAILLRSSQQLQQKQSLTALQMQERQRIISQQQAINQMRCNNSYQPPLPGMGQPRQTPTPASTSGNAPQATQSKQNSTPLFQPAPDLTSQHSIQNSNISSTVPRQQNNVGSSTQNYSPVEISAKNPRRLSNGEMAESSNVPPEVHLSTPQSSQGITTQKSRLLNPQQLAKLTPEQRRAYDASLNSSQANQSSNNPDIERLQKSQEQVSQEKPDSSIPLTEAEIRGKVRESLMGLVQVMQNLTMTFAKYRNIGTELQLRDFMRLRNRLSREFHDGRIDKEKLKEDFCISLQEVEYAKNTLVLMIRDLRHKFPRFSKDAKVLGTEGSPGSAPLSSANLQQQQQQLQKIQPPKRPLSQGSNTSAVPNSSQSPFLGPNSPHGTPAYADKKKVDIELRIPERKRQKQNNGTPGTINASSTLPGPSPRNFNSTLPGIKRKSTERSRPTIVCPEHDCDQGIGFENEEDLKRHTLEEHIRPHKDPVKYAQDNIAEALGLDILEETKKLATLEDTSMEPLEKMTMSNVNQEPFQNIKDLSTSSDTGSLLQASSTNKPTMGVEKTTMTGAGKNLPKDPANTTRTTTKEPTSQGSSPEIIKANSWASSTVNPNDLIQVYQSFESGANGSISDISAFRGITPNDTPESSKDGNSEPNSDISDGLGLDNNLDLFSQPWMPFGPSDSELLDGGFIFNRESEEDFKAFDKEPPSIIYQSFDDMDSTIFDKKFSLDSTFFAFDGN